MRIDAPGTSCTPCERESIVGEHMRFLNKRVLECSDDSGPKKKRAMAEKRVERLSAYDMAMSWQNALIGHTGAGLEAFRAPEEGSANRIPP